MVLPRWQAGVLISMFGSFCGTLGCQLRISSLTCSLQRATCLQIVGWACWITGQGSGQIAILLAPATVIACVTFSGSLLCNALLAPIVLHEKLTRAHGVGVLLLSLGGTLFTLAACHTDEEFTWAQLCELGRSPSFLCIAACCSTAALVICARTLRGAVLDLWSFAFLFALCGASDLLVTKFTLQLLRLWAVVREDAQLPPPFVLAAATSLMLTMHVATFGCQVAAAYYREALQSLPLFLGSGATLQVLLCGVFFEEFAGITAVKAAALVGGLFLVMAGMLVTSVATSCVASPAATPVESTIASPANLLTFEPPTAAAPSMGGYRPILSSGLLERQSSSLSSSDLLMLGDMQRSAMCFGGKYPVGQAPLGLSRKLRKFGSAPHFQRPLVNSTVRERATIASAPARALGFAAIYRDEVSKFWPLNHGSGGATGCSGASSSPALCEAAHPQQALVGPDLNLSQQCDPHQRFEGSV